MDVRPLQVVAYDYIETETSSTGWPVDTRFARSDRDSSSVFAGFMPATAMSADSEPSVNPWLPLCLARLSALNDVSIPLTEVKYKFTQELRWVEEVKSAIRFRLNTHCPISRLSPELLAHIFRQLAYIDEPYLVKEMGHAAGQYPGWMTVSHVCRSWRSVALDYPDLWGRGDVCSLLPWTEERLRRAKDAPFDVSRRSDSQSRIPSSVLANAHRIRCVTFYTKVCWEAVDQSWHDLLASSAIFLESFEYERSLYGDNRMPLLCDILPVNIFAREAPYLRVLRLENTLIPFESPIYENLAHLDLTCRITRTNLSFSREQLLALLQRTSKLETLALRGAVPDRSPDVNGSDPNTQLSSHKTKLVALPSLKGLELWDFQWNCIWLAEQLSIPAEASLWIRCNAPGIVESGDIGGAFMPFLIRHSGDSDCLRPVQTMSFTFDPYLWRLICWKGLVDHSEDLNIYTLDPQQTEPQSELPCCDICMQDGSVELPVLGTLRPFLEEICTSNIRILDIGGKESQIDCPNWLEYFASFTALEYLTVNNMAAFDFIEAFGLDLNLNLGTGRFTEDEGVPKVLFPNLRRLKFNQVDFKCFMETADAKLSELLVASLMERQTMNTMLEEIHLVGCRQDKHWVGILGRIGPKVFCKVGKESY